MEASEVCREAQNAPRSAARSRHRPGSPGYYTARACRQSAAAGRGIVRRSEGFDASLAQAVAQTDEADGGTTCLILTGSDSPVTLLKFVIRMQLPAQSTRGSVLTLPQQQPPS